MIPVALLNMLKEARSLDEEDGDRDERQDEHVEGVRLLPSDDVDNHRLGVRPLPVRHHFHTLKGNREEKGTRVPIERRQCRGIHSAATTALTLARLPPVEPSARPTPTSIALEPPSPYQTFAQCPVNPVRHSEVYERTRLLE